jgi:hypothetical protein
MSLTTSFQAIQGGEWKWRSQKKREREKERERRHRSKFASNGKAKVANRKLNVTSRPRIVGEEICLQLQIEARNWQKSKKGRKKRFTEFGILNVLIEMLFLWSRFLRRFVVVVVKRAAKRERERTVGLWVKTT